MKFHALIALVLAVGEPLSAAPLPPETQAKIDKIFRDWQLTTHVPGLAYGIVQDGKLVAVNGLGVQDTVTSKPVGLDSLFRIASMSKAFTALAILKLRDEGKLRLDDPAELYVPEMKGWTYPTKDSPRITVRELLNHAAGFVEDNPWGDRQQVLSAAEFTALLKSGVDFATTPGTGFEYSNLGFALLGRIVTNVSGKRYQDYIRSQIMAPLGMGSTGYDIFASPLAKRSIGYRWQDNGWVREPDMKDGEFGAMGGVETSANDYWKWVAFLLSAWPPRDDPESGPVRRSTVREIVTGSNFMTTSNRSTVVSSVPCRVSGTYAMGWRVTDDCDLGRLVTHTGGYPGYGSVVILMPDRSTGVFAFASKTYAAPSLPAFRALLALKEAGALPSRDIPVSPGLARAYDAARAVWKSGRIGDAPLANNMLLDKDAAAWTKMVDGLKKEVGTCTMDEPVKPVSAMEGKFSWTCSHGRVDGRVQRAPTREILIQALEFAPATP